MALRFTKDNHLLTYAQFQQVFKARQRIGDKFFIVYFLPNSKEHFRIGLVIAKRNVKRAVRRNYLKRIIREHFRVNPVTLSGFDFVVVVKAEASTATKEQLHTCLDKLIQRFSKR